MYQRIDGKIYIDNILRILDEAAMKLEKAHRLNPTELDYVYRYLLSLGLLLKQLNTWCCFAF